MDVIHLGGPVPRACAVVIRLTAAERHILKDRDRGGKTPWQVRVRAQIVRRAACGQSNERIARELGICTDTVRCWRARFAAGRLDGLADLPRSGRPPEITPVQVAPVRALACQLPAETGVPLSRWSCPELAAELVSRQMLPAISASTVRRILADDPIKPWQHQSWISIRDPGFIPKSARVLELYQRRRDGEPLVDNGSDHRGQAAAKRLAKAYPNAVLVHTPVHASWLNQVECFFSIVQRKVLTPNDFADLDQVEQRLLAFQDRYNATATPFKWKFTAADLAEVIARIDRHEPTPPPPAPKKTPTATNKPDTTPQAA